MVVTLFKKEFKDSYKIFFPMLGLLIGFTSLSYINYIQSYQFGSDAYYASALISNTIYRLTLITVISTVVAGIIGIVRYMYINIYNDKGYELFTLPASSLQIIIAKVMIVIIWGVIFFATFIILTIFYQSFLGESVMLENLLNRLEQLLSPTSGLLHVAGYLNQVLYIIGVTTAILFAGAIANSKYIQKGRGIVAFIIVMFIAFFVQTFEANLYIFASRSFTQNIQDMAFQSFFMTFSFFPSSLFLVLLLVFRTVCIIFLILGTKYMWERKLQFQ